MTLCHLLILSLVCVVLTSCTPLDENDAHGEGCMSKLTGEIIAFDTKIYVKGKQFICKPEVGWELTGEVLEGCSESEMLCWNWLLEESVALESTLYHRCKQYKCTEDDWALVEGAEEDSRCAGAKKGCKIHNTDETAPFGTKGYFKCEQFECTEDDFMPTGVTNPACTDGKGACWNWYKNEPITVGEKFFHNCKEFECIDSSYTDMIPTGVKDDRCS